MNTRTFTSILLSTFVLFAVFGLYLPTTTHMGHEGCPFAQTTATTCITFFSHLEHWQLSFVVVLLEFFVFALVFTWFDSIVRQDIQFVRYRLRKRTPTRPTFFQELFAQGILNRKEPQIYF